MKYLILGSEGFVGRELCRQLADKFEAKVFRVDMVPRNKIIAHHQYYRVNISKTDKLLAIIKRLRPDIIINLAGLIDGERERLFEANCFSPLRLIRALHKQKIKIVLIGSAAEYGAISGRNKIAEGRALNATSDYGLSKMVQTVLAIKEAERGNGPSIVIGRIFNMIGPGISNKLFVGAYAQKIASYEKQSKLKPLLVINPDSCRDLLSVKKVAAGIIALAQKGEKGQVYNICSGQPRSVISVVRDMLSLSRKNIPVLTDKCQPSRSDISRSVGDNKKISKLVKLGISRQEWMKELKDTLDWCRDKKQEA